ncbi:hypothetical protein MTP99_007036 [Tenebrio molitor]|nr:hypothetical protein MTP99_007036 [Tenebrio molitor]
MKFLLWLAFATIVIGAQAVTDEQIQKRDKQGCDGSDPRIDRRSLQLCCERRPQTDEVHPLILEENWSGNQCR